jgi:hypothetical protein
MDPRIARAMLSVAKGAEILVRQRQIIKRGLEQNQDVSDAERLLALFEKTQNLLDSSLERLLRTAQIT